MLLHFTKCSEVYSEKVMSVQGSHIPKDVLTSNSNIPSTEVKLTWHLLEGTVLHLPSIFAVTCAWESRVHLTQDALIHNTLG